MEILEILKQSKNEIYPEDLDFFETELATGDYSDSYIVQCREQIALTRKWLLGEEEKAVPQEGEKKTRPKDSKGTLVMGIQSLAPQTANPAAASLSPEEIIFLDIKSMRESDSYKTKFKKYVQDMEEINTDFLNANFSFFMQWEMDAIVSAKQLEEAFLEKYFGALDKDKIARYQCFSESFYMKHFSQLDAAIVLVKGKNEWRKKENRSKQLDVFLRLKGVKL